MLWLVALPPPGFGTFATEPEPAQAERLSRTSYSGGTGGGDDYIKKNDDEMEYDIINNKYDSSEPCIDYDGWEAADHTEMNDGYTSGAVLTEPGTGKLVSPMKYANRDCRIYSEFCSTYEEFFPGKGEDASVDGIKAKVACCGCGGGISAGQCEAIGYKQDDGMVARTCEASGYEKEDLAAQLAQLKEEALQNTRQLAKLRTEQEQTNELITQLAASAEERNTLAYAQYEDDGKTNELLTQLAASAEDGNDLAWAQWEETQKTNERLTQLTALLTQLAESAAQRKLSDLVIAKAAGSSAADLKAGFSLAELSQAGFSAAELKAAGFLLRELKAIPANPFNIFTTNQELKAAIDKCFEIAKHVPSCFAIASWDVSGIEDFSEAFNLLLGGRNADLDLIAPDIRDWDVSNGKNFYQMFAGATVFNADISKWDVSKGKNFDEMFYGAKAFNRDLGDWDVSQGTSFENMFKGADACEVEPFVNQISGKTSSETCGVCLGTERGQVVACRD